MVANPAPEQRVGTAPADKAPCLQRLAVARRHRHHNTRLATAAIWTILPQTHAAAANSALGCARSPRASQTPNLAGGGARRIRLGVLAAYPGFENTMRSARSRSMSPRARSPSSQRRIIVSAHAAEVDMAISHHACLGTPLGRTPEDYLSSISWFDGRRSSRYLHRGCAIMPRHIMSSGFRPAYVSTGLIFPCADRRAHVPRLWAASRPSPMGARH